MTEEKIQNILAAKFNRGGNLCVPNCGVFGWEADLIRVSPRLYADEYEIKVTRADFRADRKKYFRINALESAGSRASANRFWYAAPVGVVPLDELPAYAGLIEVYGFGGLRVVVAAPRIHAKPLDVKQLMFLTRGCALRYWQQRAA